MFNSFTFWLQMSHFSVAVERVWRKKWKKHMIVCVIQSALTICFFAKHLFPIVKLKQSSADTNRHFNCTGPFSRFQSNRFDPSIETNLRSLSCSFTALYGWVKITVPRVNSDILISKKKLNLFFFIGYGMQNCIFFDSLTGSYELRCYENSQHNKFLTVDGEQSV